MLGERDVDRLLSEHGALLRAHARLQARCAVLLGEQAERLRRLDAELIRTRAAAIRSLSALACSGAPPWAARSRPCRRGCMS